MTIKNFLFILPLLAAAGCAPSGSDGSDALPRALSVIEESPSGMFVRLVSPDRVSRSQMLEAVAEYSQRFDRIDFCVYDSTAHGQEYITVIGGCVFDHDADQCFTITSSDYDTL